MSRFELVHELALWCDRTVGTDWSVRRSEKISGNNDNMHIFDGSRVSFCRVPKTGSTTVARVLKLLAYDRCVNLDPHLPVSRACPPGKYQYLTFVREPCDRVWSHYQMVKRHGGHEGWAIHAARGFEYYLTHCWEAQNMMVKYFTGKARCQVDESDLDVAFENLRKFYFVGCFENLEFDTHRLLELLGRPTPGITLPHETRAFVPKEKMSATQLDIVRRHNALDIALY